MSSIAKSQVRLAITDLVEGMRRSRVWGMMGWQDIKQRYRRSVLGPFWLTISTGVTIVALGLVYATIFRVPLDQYLPFLAIGLVTWNFIASVVTDGCQVFVASEATIKQIRLQFTIYVFRALWRNILIFAHNAVIIVAVLAVYGSAPSAARTVLLLAGLAVIALSATWVILLLGLVCTRFRDVQQIVTSVLQLVFFMTPILWHPSLLAGRQRLVEWNPFHHYVEVVRAPLLGVTPSLTTWAVVVSVTIVGWAITLGMFQKYRRRIAYWV